MKRKFTILTAALVLLVCLALPMGMRADEAQYVFNTDAGIAALGIEKPSEGAGTSLSTTTPYTVGQISMSVTHGSTDTRVWNSSGTLDLRIYKSGGSLTFTAASGYNISGVTITGSAVGNFSVNCGTYSSGSWSNGTTGASTVIFTATNTGKINKITVTYSASGSTLQASDLALVNAPVELEFDLYDNASAQTISYTTSSTGAVTVSQSDYITATVNANNTITVTPVAVTNGPQTITVNQAADDTYDAGSVTFTVDIEDSTPSTGSDVTFDATVDKDLNNTTQGECSIVKNGVTFTCSDGILGNGTEYRLYKNSTTTFSVESGTITQIVFTCTSGNPASGFATQTGWTTNGSNGTWTGNATSVSFVASSKQVRATQIVVTVEGASSVDTPTFNPVDGTVIINEDYVLLECATENASIYYTMGENPADPTNASTLYDPDEGIEVTQSTTIKAIAYLEGEYSNVATATYTVIHPLTTMQAIFDDATDNNDAHTVYITFNNWVVTGISGSEAFVTDGTKGFMIYKSNHGFSVGQKLSGTAECTLKLYNGSAEITNWGTGLNATDGGSVTPYEASISDLSGVNTGAVVRLNNVTYNGSVLVDADNNTITPYDKFYSYSFETGNNYNVTGVYYQQSTSPHRIMPRSAEDIVDLSVQYYTIMFSVNGYDGGTRDVIQGQAIGTLPTPTENIPAGFTFVGWMKSPDNAYYNATTAPEMVAATWEPDDDYILDAVFCIAGNTEGTWSLSNAAPVDGEEVILATLDNGTYYAFFANGSSASATALTVNNGVISNAPETVWSVSTGTQNQNSEPYTGLAFSNSSATGYLHFNSSAIKVANGYGNGLFEFNEIQGSSAFEMHGILNDRYLTYNSSFGVSDSEDDACPVYVFKYTVNTTAAKDYTTSVINHADQTLIAENAEETLYGIHYINGYVLAGNDVTNEGKIVVTTGGYLDMYEAALYSFDPEILVIEDGAQLYTDDVVEATIKKNISAYDPSLVGQGVSNGWYFISYPLNTYGTNGDVPTSVTNMISSSAQSYDLYLFDGTGEEYGQEIGKEWVNYKGQGHTQEFFLCNGHGYLYANANDVTLEFAGSLNFRDPDKDFVSLDNTGWNLVGNPFAYNTYPSLPYYKMNDAGTGIEANEYTTADAVAPCTGILVNSDAGLITFSKNAPSGAKGSINLALAKNERGAAQMDNAILSFNEGSQLGKFYFGTQNANLYIPQGIEEYAIVNTEAQGEMPVNFRANEDGQYTLTVNPENVDMNYLHLIDNMTGMDIDLLQTPSYTFNAKVNDYESRFRLVFSANNEDASTGSTAFAFFCNGNLIVNNEGNATLQVIDINGRILSSETISGSCSKAINATTGVYMLRLINGENVKVQKVVVR